jgi:hypothetical protein
MTTPKVERLVKRLDELAQSVPPPRDLWPAIAQALEAHESEKKQGAESQVAGAKRRPAWWMPAMGMAAAVALVSIGVFIGQQTSKGTSPMTAGTQQVGDPAMVKASQRDANYREQRDALLVEVNDRLKTMPEGERAKVAASLKTLQRSISDIEAALGKDPANALLQELLVNSCQEEMRALTAVRDSGSQET